MAEGSIRVNKVLKDYNIGLSTLTDFLKKKGINDELTLTSKISGDVFALVAKEFGKEQLIKEQSQKVSIKLKEITDVDSNRSNAEEEEPVKEVIIKTNVFTEQKKVESPAPKAEPEPDLHRPIPPVQIRFHSSRRPAASIRGLRRCFRRHSCNSWKILLSAHRACLHRER